MSCGRVNSTQAAGVAAGRVDSESAVDVSARLIEFNSLPRVLCRLADPGALSDSGCVGVSLILLILNVTLHLVLAEAKWQVQLKSLIILPRRWLLKACLIRVGSIVASTTFGGAARILRALVVRGAICGGRRR